VGTPAKTPSNKSSLSTNANVNVKNANDAQAIVEGIWNRYVADTPQRTKLIDAFMGFLVVVGGLQFLYCVIAGNYVSVFLCLCFGIGSRVVVKRRVKRFGLGRGDIEGKGQIEWTGYLMVETGYNSRLLTFDSLSTPSFLVSPRRSVNSSLLLV